MNILRPAIPLRSSRLAKTVIALVAATAVLAAGVPGALALTQPPGSASVGYDVSWPNCSRTTRSSSPVTVVGVTGGKAFTTNPCLRAEYVAARQHHAVVAFYINLNSPTGTIGRTGPAGRCGRKNLSCQAYNYGYRAAAAAWSYAVRRIGRAPLWTRWWLDVETMNRWSSRTSVNARVIAGALAFLRSRGHANRVGIYSTNYQWRTIAGSYRPGVATWYATVARTARAAARYCGRSYAFAGGPVKLVQFWPTASTTTTSARSGQVGP